MRRATVAALLALAACKKPAPAPAPAPSASVAIVTKEPAPSASASAAPPPPIPRTSDKLELVAGGKSPASKIIWLKALGSHVWLSGHNLDAFAEGDGPLQKVPDPLAKLTYTAGQHRLDVTGHYPHLFLLRTDILEGRSTAVNPAIFLRAPDGSWTPAKPLGINDVAHAWIPYKDGALFVQSVVVGNAMPTFVPWADKVGTTARLVHADGSVEPLDLGIPRTFLAWDAEAGGDRLSLLGTIGVKTKDKDRPDEYDSVGIQVFRVGPNGGKTVTIQHAFQRSMMSYTVRIRQNGTRAVVLPPNFPITEVNDVGWRPNGQTMFVIGDDDKPVARAFPSAGEGNDCTAKDAAVAGDDVYVIRDCFDGTPIVVLRVDAKGRAATLPLPKYAGAECAPESLVMHGADDLWVAAGCGPDRDIPAVFRLGRPQTPVELP